LDIPTSIASHPSPLLERDDALERLSDLARAAAGGQGAIVSILGRPGEGKTTLLTAARALAEEHGLRVCRARGSELECDFAFGVVRQLLESEIMALEPQAQATLFDGAAGLARSVFGLQADSPPESPFVLLHGLYWMLAALAANGPLLLAVDDLHWADETSLGLLAYLRGRIDDLPILVVLATRGPEPDEGPLATLARDPGIATLSVGPLGEESAAMLIEHAFETPPDPLFTAACQRVTAGNPFAICELLGELRRAGAAPDPATAATLDEHAPAGLERSVLARLGRLDVEALAVAHALAVLEDGAPLRQVAAFSDLDLDRVAGAVDALVGVGILEEGTALHFVHPLLRIAVYESISARRRARLHAAAARLLAAEHADPQAIAAQLLHADPAGDPVSVEHLRAAARAALERGAPGIAVTHLRRALAEPPANRERATVLAELGRAELVVRDPAAGIHLQAALDLTRAPLARALLALDLSEICLYAGEHARLFELLELALQAAAGRDGDLVLSIERRRLTMAIAANLAVGVADRPTRARLIELAAEDRPAARPIRIVLATYISMDCAPATATLPLLRAGLQDGHFLAAETADAPEAVHAAIVLISYDELAQAIELTSAMLADAARRGSVLGFIHGATFRALAHLRAGALVEAEADALDALRLLGEQPVGEQALEFIVPFPTSYLSAVLRERGHYERAAALLDGVSLPLAVNGRIAMLETRARLRAQRGDAEGAIGDLEMVGALPESVRLRHPGYQRWRSQLALALPAGERARARALAASELADARQTGVSSAIGVALAASATLAPAAAERATLWEQAVTSLEGSPARLELARALVGQGSELRRSGKRAQARQPLRRALELASRCGAEPLATVAAEELRAADGRPRRPWLSGVDALTPSELRVARQAAAGHSNREIAQALFVTTKTVEMHLSNAYRKLGIDSREKLPSALGADGVSPAGGDLVSLSATAVFPN
jgi:DNA-binding CsgD family transcriptional regulator